MKVKIESDVFDIVDRIKTIDEGYYIVFDLCKGRYELHNSNQPNTYCISIPYDEIDEKLINLIYGTNIDNIDNIIEDIDKYNANIENNNNKSMKNQTDYMVREIYNFANNSSKFFDSDKAFKSIWS